MMNNIEYADHIEAREELFSLYSDAHKDAYGFRPRGEHTFLRLQAMSRDELQREFDLGVIFVTHDIEEAIFMASRVIVMTARPGRIKADVPVDLGHPRHYTVKTSPEFSRLKAQLTEEIRAEAVLAAREH